MKDLSIMRARDLKRLLLKLGVEESLISKLLDKKELIALASSLIEEQEQEKNNQYKSKIAYQFMIILVVIFILYIAKDLIAAFSNGLLDFFFQEFYLLSNKLKTVKVAVRYSRYYAIAGLILSACCDSLVSAIQFSIMASWIIPQGNFLRQYLISTFSLPMSPNTILGFGSSSFAIDVGPMVTIWVLKWLSKKFEEIIGQQLIDIADSKNSKRFKKFYNKM